MAEKFRRGLYGWGIGHKWDVTNSVTLVEFVFDDNLDVLDDFYIELVNNYAQLSTHSVHIEMSEPVLRFPKT